MVSRNNSILNLEIKGARSLEAALMALGQDRLIKSTLRRALLLASAPVVKTAQQNAARHTGRMAGKVAVSSTLSRRQRRGGQYRRDPSTAHVWIGTGPRGPGTLVEFGTGPRYQKRTKKYVGAMPAQPFMRPAWEQHKHQVLEDFTDILWAQIEKSAKRLARRQMKAAGIRL